MIYRRHTKIGALSPNLRRKTQKGGPAMEYGGIVGKLRHKWARRIEPVSVKKPVELPTHPTVIGTGVPKIAKVTTMSKQKILDAVKAAFARSSGRR